MIKARHAMGKILTACLFLAQVISLTAEEEGGLHTQFADPLVEYRPGVFWEWCNGNINRAGITSDYIARHCALPDGNEAPSTNK